MENNIEQKKWTTKHWSTESVSNILKEVIEPESVDVTSIQMHDRLSQLIWDENDILKSDVRKALLLNVKRFIEFSDVQKLSFNDIILTGSIANFNYNENSDIDIHIILDFSQISENEEFVGDYLKLKKQLWSDSLPIQIKGHDVELYFQNSTEPHHSTGTYSIINSEWLSKPLKKIVNINTNNIKLKSADFMNAIDDLGSNKNKKNWMDNYDKLKRKIKNYRQSGLGDNGEYSTENLVFKVLRNTGYLAKLADEKKVFMQDELTLNEFK
jgi:predicted nucleotidyltransferase